MSSYPFKRTCKEVSALLIAREDRDLPVADRLALRLHMAMCQACHDAAKAVARDRRDAGKGLLEGGTQRGQR